MRLRRTAVTVALLLAAAACGGDGEEVAAAPGSVTVGSFSNGAATPATLDVAEVAAIRDTLPAAVTERGTLTVGLGGLPSGAPPLFYVGDDQKTLTGSEPDLARLVAGVLGLEPVLTNATWDNLFVGIDSGRSDIGFSNITVTEQRKQKYDFACYREDNLAFEVKNDNPWEFDGDFRNLAGLTVAVGAGTNQEKILLEWQTQLKKAGQELDVVYFPDESALRLALSSGRIDAYFGPSPSIAYHVTRLAGTPNPTRSAGSYSGAGATLQGLICATARKGSGLAAPVAAAINHLIDNGQYAAWLKAWNLSDEAVETSEVNPPGLPLDNS